ncbi:alpha-L-fucosidase [Niabella ginsenosidivorans]|uniref:Alpha-L-fucosidase n=1 Tax=Niabella ginsenosidivorans TaxID=1176587 RepID=A0A1A9I3H7_9BACT|nr:glycoside hydrolase family 95 protein [Niabella ginsenosidivorans]ANH82227.1 alpha-L-fucosidase [Niabella ginsenosidivorans]
MNCRLFFILFLSLTALVTSAQKPHPLHDLKLWYTKPASIWEEALPLGNGKTGAMVFGGVIKERFQLNDNTLWSGAPNPGNTPGGPAILADVRKLIFQGLYDSATRVWKKMQGPYSARYLPMADLWLNIHSSDTIARVYYRDLDLNTAVATVSYELNGVRYQRETFISYPDKAMIIRITADRKNAISLDASLSSKLKYKVSAYGQNGLLLKGKAPKFVANRVYEPQQVVYNNWDGEGTNFEVQLKVIAERGTVKSEQEQLIINKANSVTFYVTNATSFNGFNRSPGRDGKDPHTAATAIMNTVIQKPFDLLKQQHVKDYRQLFSRVDFSISSDAVNAGLPTNERLKLFAKAPDDFGLQTLYYQYGRYLMIAASRPGSRPTNLQGIWNDQVQPPWGSNYTTNINTEMNYWLAENTNLPECHQPLFDFIKELAVNGAVTAKENYGINEGWVAHHNSDIWAKTSPPGGQGWNDPSAKARWSCWPMAAGWFSTHLWEHYLYSGNERFLRDTAYPLMKGAAQFLLHWLVKDPATGYLVTNPSSSPENVFKINGQEHELSMASTMDMSIIRELFTDVIKAAALLKTDAAFAQALLKAKAQLYPFRIGRYGQLQEWFKDWDDPKDQHRHLSHLFGLYPGSQITLSQEPELAAAAKQSLIFRGDVSTGWSMAWKINWWARLHDGEHAYKILSDAFTYIDPREKRETMSGGGTYPNLFDAHPPFQIDGNFGATAGMTEMLLQSHEGYLFLLPALPSVWKKGVISGIKARGNFTVAINWDNGRLSKATIYSEKGGVCRLRTLQPVKVLEVQSENASGTVSNALLIGYGKTPYDNRAKKVLQQVNPDKGYTIDFKTEKGKQYTVIPL